MRIVAGKFRSRALQAPKGDQTRPTLDKVREAVFSRIGPYFDGGAVLDLFAGSGAVGLEALSRGMDQAVFVDISAQAVSVIRSNAETLNVQDQCQIWKADCFTALRRLAESGRQFDLVYLDPPYKRQQLQKVMTLLSELKLVGDQGRVILESLKEDTFDDQIDDLIKEKEAVYGISRISYYRKEGKP